MVVRYAGDIAWCCRRHMPAAKCATVVVDSWFWCPARAYRLSYCDKRVNRCDGLVLFSSSHDVDKGGVGCYRVLLFTSSNNDCKWGAGVIKACFHHLLMITANRKFCEIAFTCPRCRVLSLNGEARDIALCRRS